MSASSSPDRLRRRRWAVVALVLISGLTAGAIYKWVDQQGRVQYSDRPPAGQKADVVEVAPSPTREQQQVATEELEELTRGQVCKIGDDIQADVPGDDGFFGGLHKVGRLVRMDHPG